MSESEGRYMKWRVGQEAFSEKKKRIQNLSQNCLCVLYGIFFVIIMLLLFSLLLSLFSALLFMCIFFGLVLFCLPLAVISDYAKISITIRMIHRIHSIWWISDITSWHSINWFDNVFCKKQKKKKRTKSWKQIEII